MVAADAGGRHQEAVRAARCGPSRLRKTDEDSTLSGISVGLQIQAIYRESTGNRGFRFFAWWPPIGGAKCRRQVAVAGVRAHKSETRISAIADFARKGKREKKALPLSPRALPPRAFLRLCRRAGFWSVSAQRGEHLAFCGEPMFIGLAVGLTMGVPDLVGALPNAVFQGLLHLVPPFC